LFGVQPYTDRIVEIDPATGTITRSIPSPDPYPKGGLSGIDHGRWLLYQSATGNNTSGNLCWLDPLTGEIAQSASYYLPDTFPGGLTAQNYGDHQIITLGGKGELAFWHHPNPLAQVPTLSSFEERWIVRGALGGDGFGRAFAFCVDDWESNSYAIVEFDPSGESFEPIHIMPFSRLVGGLAFDGQFLYAASYDDLLTLDPETSEILNTVSVPDGFLSALAVAVPEPGSLGVLLLLLPATVVRRPRVWRN